MKIKLYHGTTPAVATELDAGKINISLGGGEFGQGFYMGNNKRLAVERGFHATLARHGEAAAKAGVGKNVFFVEVDSWDYIRKYKNRPMNLKESRKLYRKLKRKKRLGSVVGTHDSYYGHIVGNKKYYQYGQIKFESISAENMLNVLPITSPIIGRGIE